MTADKNNMYTGNDYLEKNPGYHIEDSGWKAEMILEMLTKNNILPKTITDLGCGAGGVLKQMASKMSDDIAFTGYDISSNAIDLAEISAPVNVKFRCGNYFDISATKADLLLVIDVLEHLEDYHSFLRQLRQRASHIIFHIPLDLSSRSVLRPHILKQQRDSVGHIHYFTRDMVWWFLQDAGFAIIDWRFTKPVSDLNASPTFFRSVKKRLRNFSFAINPDLSSKLWGDYSVLILAR